jgi:hypothetical protein
VPRARATPDRLFLASDRADCPRARHGRFREAIGQLLLVIGVRSTFEKEVAVECGVEHCWTASPNFIYQVIGAVQDLWLARSTGCPKRILNAADERRFHIGGYDLLSLLLLGNAVDQHDLGHGLTPFICGNSLLL